jgi:hypothetical protein
MSIQLHQRIVQLIIPGRKPEIAMNEEEYNKDHSHKDMGSLEEFIKSIPGTCQTLFFPHVSNVISPNEGQRHEGQICLR